MRLKVRSIKYMKIVRVIFTIIILLTFYNCKTISEKVKAIDLNLQDAEAYNNRGLVKNKKGDYDGAIFEFTKAIELSPQYADAYYNRGNAKDAKGDYDGAILDYTKAIELNPQDAEAYYN